MAHELLGLSMDEFLYDYNPELTAYMINKKIELKTGVKLDDQEDNEPKQTEARAFFSELGF